MTATLEVRNVVVDYGGLRAVDDVSFSVAPGEIVGFIGPNGSGKTTLLDVVSGQTPTQAGAVWLDGVDLNLHLPEDRAALGLVRSFQDCLLYGELSVEETLLVAEDARRPAGVFASALRLPGARKAEREKLATVQSLMASLGLERFRHNLIGELSTGTRRIVDLAAILAAQPRLLLLDEPTSGIAQREAEALGPLLRRLHELTGATICLVEHDVRLVFSLCDRVFVMEAGRVVASGRAAEVQHDPVAIAAYLGASEEALGRSGLVGEARAGAKRPTLKAKETRRTRRASQGE
ncbi:MAG TPA: ATP-binding cassette domain-containing protein [Acidimicrobiales bacterium]|nr:ATP-binding cassette domain-containing protein [Acidimicrobiales bacterium]